MWKLMTFINNLGSLSRPKWVFLCCRMNYFFFGLWGHFCLSPHCGFSHSCLRFSFIGVQIREHQLLFAWELRLTRSRDHLNDWWCFFMISATRRSLLFSCVYVISNFTAFSKPVRRLALSAHLASSNWFFYYLSLVTLWPLHFDTRSQYFTRIALKTIL